MARLPDATRESFPEELRYVWDRSATDGVVPNIFRAMGNKPTLLRAYLRLGNALWANTGLDTRTRELLILRTAMIRGSKYEWHQHVRIGRAAGLTDDHVLALQDWRASTIFTDQERALLAYTDVLAGTGSVSQTDHDALAAVFPASTVVGVNLLVDFYVMTARFLETMDVQTEERFIGWRLDGG